MAVAIEIPEIIYKEYSVGLLVENLKFELFPPSWGLKLFCFCINIVVGLIVVEIIDWNKIQNKMKWYQINESIE